MDPIVRSRAAALVLLVTFGCGPGAEEPDSKPTPPTPESIATELRAAIQIEGQPPTLFTVEERLAHHNVPGVSVAVLDGGELAWAAAWGMADAEREIPATPETLFQAASISKPVAALGALSLVEEGALLLDGPINEHLTSWQVPENEFTADSVVTLRRILTHTAGLTVWGFPGYRRDQDFGSGRPVATNVEVLDGAGNTPAVRVYRTPGIGWQYSGGGYTVMEEAMENVTGRPFHEVMRDRVLGPAQMARSTYEQPLPEARWPEAARAHTGTGARVEGEWHNYPEQAAAGLWTTPSDMILLSAHLLGILHGAETAGIVSRETLLSMLAPHRTGEEGFGGHGLGLSVEGEGDALSFGHGGSNRGFRAMWTVFPERGQGVMVMTNGDRGGSLIGEIIRAVAEAYGWPRLGPQVRRVARLSREALEEYAGRYEMEGPEALSVSLRTGSGSLIAEVPGQGTVILRPDAEQQDTFFDPTDGLEAVFQRGHEGSVQAFVLQGRNRFVRR